MVVTRYSAMVMCMIMPVVVVMIVAVIINRHQSRHVIAEQADKFRVPRHHMRLAGAADMVIKADNLPRA